MADLLTALAFHPHPPPRIVLSLSDRLTRHRHWQGVLPFAYERGLLTLKMMRDRHAYLLTHASTLSPREHEFLRLLEAEIGTLS